MPTARARRTNSLSAGDPHLVDGVGQRHELELRRLQSDQNAGSPLRQRANRGGAVANAEFPVDGARPPRAPGH